MSWQQQRTTTTVDNSLIQLQLIAARPISGLPARVRHSECYIYTRVFGELLICIYSNKVTYEQQ